MNRWRPATIPASGHTAPRSVADPRDLPLAFDTTPAPRSTPGHAGAPMSHAPNLSLRQAARALQLQTELAALHEAQACVTEGCTPSQAYGRIGDLAHGRRVELDAIYTAAHSTHHD